MSDVEARRLLVVDTCGSEGTVAVVELLSGENRVRATRVLPGRETSSRLMPALREVLREAGVELHALSAIAVVHGPGSFTGVRIGVAAAKALAEATRLPLIAISRLQMLAARGGKGTVHALLDAGRGDVYVGTYQGGVCVSERIAHAAGVEALFHDGATVVVAETALATRFPQAQSVEPLVIEDASAIAAAKLESGAFSDVALLDANYLRVPDAELALRAAQAAAGNDGR